MSDQSLPFENPTQYGLVDREGNTNAEGIGTGGGIGGAPERAERAMQAMLGMGKLDIVALRRAADGVPAT